MSADAMKKMAKNILSIAVVVLFLGATLLPTVTSGSVKLIGYQGNKFTHTVSNTNQELYLLYGKTIFSLRATEDVESFNVVQAIPPNYEDQAPIFFNIQDGTTANITNYRICNDTNHPNKVINFTIGPMKKNEVKSIHFEYWVLVKNKKYEDLPEHVKMPAEKELPNETKTWLASTKAIQSNNSLIKIKARQLLRKSNGNLRTYADKIVSYTCLDKDHLFRGKYHTTRYLIFHVNLPTILFYLFPNKISQANAIGHISGTDIGVYGMFHDAVSVLLSYGVCSGVANLGAALFRANDVPAKQLILTPMLWGSGGNQSFAMHCICEYYCPGYGWVWAETTGDKTPYEPKNAIVLRVNYPEDENKAGQGLHAFGGLEQWAWITNNNVFRNGKTWGWSESNLTVDLNIANDAFNITQDVWELYTQYAGRDLGNENYQHFFNATTAQQNAIECVKQLDVGGFSSNITIACNEYNEIEYP